MLLRSLVVIALCACVVLGEDSVYANDRPWTAMAYEPVADEIVLAFSPYKTNYQQSFGLETRRCSETVNCGDASTTYEAVPCLRDTTAQAIVEDISIHFVPSSSNVFGGQYMLYTEYNPALGGHSDHPAANNLMLYICSALGCVQSVAENYNYIILENGYFPDMAFVSNGPGKKLPAIAYVGIPKKPGSGYLPSVDHVGQLMLTVCTTATCDATQERKIANLDPCLDPKDPDAATPMCAGVSMTITNGFPQILYYGPSTSVATEGMWLKILSCTDIYCQNTPTIVPVYRATTEVTPYGGQAKIITRKAGFPAFVHIKSDGDLYLTRCQEYDCTQQKEDRITSGLLSQSQAEPDVAANPDGIPVIVYIRTVNTQNHQKRDLMIVYCLDEPCTSWTSPEVLTDCSSDACKPAYPKVTATSEHVVVTYWDMIEEKDYMFVCANTTCTPAEVADMVELDTTWGNDECNGLFPAPAGSPHKKKTNGGAIAAGIIISLIAIAAVAVFAYWFAVIRNGGRWPWESISQPKGLDSYAEL